MRTVVAVPCPDRMQHDNSRRLISMHRQALLAQENLQQYVVSPDHGHLSDGSIVIGLQRLDCSHATLAYEDICSGYRSCQRMGGQIQRRDIRKSDRTAPTLMQVAQAGTKRR